MRHIGGSETTRNILVDSSALFYMSHFIFKDSKKFPVIYGAFELLSRWIRDVNRPTAIHIFFDGYPKRRKDIFPEYKSKRNLEVDVKLDSSTADVLRLRDGSTYRNQIELISYLYELLGCKTYYLPDEESDDLIASFVEQNKDNVNVIVSDDKDFFQLISPRTVIYRPLTKGNKFFDIDRSIEYWQSKHSIHLPPENVLMFKVLTGDSSDGIPGIPRLRKKVAAPLCCYKDIDSLFESKFPGFSKAELGNVNREKLELNLKLVSLVKDLDLSPGSRDADFSRVRDILCEFGIDDVDLAAFNLSKSQVKSVPLQPEAWVLELIS